MTDRIDAPKRIIDTIQDAQRQVEQINIEVKAMLFGAATALDVPEGWTWDGRGWIAPNPVAPVDDTRG
jgi:hypothetical protein